MERIGLVARIVAIFTLGTSSILPVSAFAASKPDPAEASEGVVAGQSHTVLPDGKELSVGGVSAGTLLNSASLMSVQTGARTGVLHPLLHPRAFHSATLLPDGRVLIFGGIGKNNSLVTQAELFDPTIEGFRDGDVEGMTPRSNHSATLLTDGRVLFAGGIDNQGHTLTSIELWDFRSGHVSTLSQTLNTPRSGHSARLLADGSVLLWGGLDANGTTLKDGEIIDPDGPTVRLVGRPDGDLPQPTYPYLEASIPQNGETNVETDRFVSLRFSRPLDGTTLNSSTVSLRTGVGNVAINIVPAEGGTLAFITSRNTLDTDTTYTLSVSRAKDKSGQPVPETTIQFTTSGSVTTGLIAGGVQPSVAAASNSAGETQSSSSENSEMPSDLRQLPMRKAPDGVTALTGQVLTLNRQPLPDVRIELDSQFAMTDNTGRFVVQNVGSGHHVMVIDGSTAHSKSASYGLYRVGVDLKAGRTNSLNYTIWMTALDTAHEVSIPSPTSSEMVLTNPNVPGLEVHIPPGTVIRDARGRVVTHIGITPIPVSQPPFPLKSGVQYPVYFTIQPGGATIEVNEGMSPSSQPKGITIHYQNYLNAKPGSRYPFWKYDPEQKGWFVYGHGRVTDDAKEIAPEHGTEIHELDGAMTSEESNADENGQKPCLDTAPAPCNLSMGEPVDLQTGLFVYRKTDLNLDDIIPISLTRVYRPGDFNQRAFGIGMSMPLDDFMTGDNDETPEGYTYQDLNLEDGGKIHFTRISPCLGSGGYCDFSNALYEATSVPGEFYGATLQYIGYGPYSNELPTSDYWQLTTKDGTIYLFADSDGSTNPKDAALQAMQDRYGNVLTFTRDANSNLTQISSPNGRWIQFSYDANNLVTQAQDNLGRTTSYTYNNAGYLATATDANGGTTTYSYDDSGDMVSIQDPRGIVYVQNQYDANGRVSNQTQADGGTYLFSYVVDANGNVTQTTVTDPRGVARQATFNTDGWMTSDVRAVGRPEEQTTTFNRQAGTGLLLSLTDALNRTTSYSYDAMANVTSMTQLAGTANAATSTFTYDEKFGEPTSVTDPLGNVTVMTYDSLGSLIAASDPLGNTSMLTYSPAGQLTSLTDSLGNATQFTYDSGNLVSVTDPLGRTSTRFADSAGRVVSVTDPLNDTTNIVYDPLDRITSMTDPMGNQTLFAYDGDSNLLAVTDANQHTTSYTYDNMERVAVHTDPLGHSEYFQYDNSGNLTQATDRKGQVTIYQYDGLNRPLGEQFNDGSTIANTYDAGNRLTAISDSLAGTISRSYDGLDNMLSETTPQGSVTYSYDADQRRQSMTVAGQPQINYAFDNASRLTAITQGSSNVAFSYDSADRRISLTLPNGVIAKYSYDAASQLTGIVYQGAGAPDLDNLSYTYDLAGRRTSISGTLASTQLPAAVSNAVYNANNQLTEWGATSMAYDANGNTLNDGMNSYVWDARNRLISANSNSAIFAYDPIGRRTGRSILSATTNYLYDGANPVQELTGSTVTANLLTGGIDEYFTRTDSNGTSNFLTDALGSTVELKDSAGNAQAQYSYGPFGAISITGTTNNSNTYTGREADGLGLYYDRARYYNPQTGRFLSEDPFGFDGGGPNFYAYAGDDPVDLVDSSGLDPKKKECEDLLNQMMDDINAVRPSRAPQMVKKGMAQRFRQMLRLPFKSPETFEGYVEAFQNQQTNLKKKIQNYRNTGCGDPPSAISDWANQPIASPYPQGTVPPMSSSSVTAGAIVGGVVVIGGTLILCPECIVAAPILAF